MSINAVEGYPLEEFSADAVRNQIAEAQKIAGGSGSQQDIAEANIELEVCLDVAHNEEIHADTTSLGSGESSGCAEVDGAAVTSVHI